MSSIKLLLGSGLLWFLCMPIAAQSFSASPLEHDLVFASDQFVFYSYSTLTNHTGQDMPMGWKKYFPRPYPSTWDNTIEVPDTFYTQGETSGTFVLEAIPEIPEKLICQFYPNHTIATADVIIRVYPLADTTDYIDITWKARTIVGTTSIDPRFSHGTRIFPNPADTQIRLIFPRSFRPVMVEGRDWTGRLINRINSNENSALSISTNTWPSGMYWLTAIDSAGDQLPLAPIIIQH